MGGLRARIGMVAGCLGAGLMLGVPVVARGDAVLSGTVTSGETPVAGAFVSIVGTSGQQAASTDASGGYAATVATGTDYTIRASAPGYTVTTVGGVTVGGDPVSQDIVLTSSGSKFQALGVFGGQIGTVLADGRSGVFYASTSVIPQLYRTADYGGTWAPVTLAADDPTNGLFGGTNLFNRDAVTTSGFPGEIAAALDHKVYYSTDFGVTWKQVTGPVGMANTLSWGHAGTTSILLVGDGTSAAIQRADMTAPSPALVPMTTSYLASGDDRLAVGDGIDAAYVAVVSAAGTLTIYALNATDDPPVAVGAPLSNVLAQPTFVRLGGQKESGAPPDAFLVLSAASHTAVMGTKAGNHTSFHAGDLSAATDVSICALLGGPVGAVSPLSSGATGDGTVAQCLLHKSGGGALTVTQVNGINNNTGLVFDAAYGAEGGAVIISGDGNRGLVKSAAVGTPSFPSGQDAAAGTDPTSGGVAVNGFNVAVVKDTVFGPAGASQVGVILSMSGGGLSLASDDGGTTFRPVVKKGGRAITWWAGTGGTSWLVFGYGGGGDLLAAIADWTASTPALGNPNVAGTTNTQISIGTTFEVSALQGVPGTGTLFVGSSQNEMNSQGAAGALVRTELAAGNPPTLGAITPLADGQLNAGVQALAYCPAEGAAPGVGDVLFVATGTQNAPAQAGSLVRITGATGASPGVTVVASVPATAPVNDVRVHCGSGTVYVGTGTSMGGPSGVLYKSTDGGVTFAPVAIAAPGVPPSLNVQVVAVNPDDPDEVLLAGNSDGFILHSADGGTTWTVVNDPMHGRNFLSEGVGDLEIPPAPSALVTGRFRPDVAAPRALVGTGGGLYAANVLAASVPCTTAAECDDGDACTTEQCSAGRCVITQPSDFAGASCELGQLGSVCGTEKLDKKMKAVLKKSVKALRAVVARASHKAGNAKKLAKLLGAANRLAQKIATKAGKSRVSADCKAKVAARLELVRTILKGLG